MKKSSENEFPLRIGLGDLKVLLGAGLDAVSPAEFIHWQQMGLSNKEIHIIETLRALQVFMKARRCDPGFQVVIGE